MYKIAEISVKISGSTESFESKSIRAEQQHNGESRSQSLTNVNEGSFLPEDSYDDDEDVELTLSSNNLPDDAKVGELYIIL